MPDRVGYISLLKKTNAGDSGGACQKAAAGVRDGNSSESEYRKSIRRSCFGFAGWYRRHACRSQCGFAEAAGFGSYFLEDGCEYSEVRAVSLGILYVGDRVS